MWEKRKKTNKTDDITCAIQTVDHAQCWSQAGPKDELLKLAAACGDAKYSGVP